MKPLYRVIPALMLICLQVSSCRWISSFIHDEEIIAEAAGRKLYRSELDASLPKGISVEDSTFLADRYIVSWASGCIYQDAAERNLSETEKNVEQELEEYRASLLKYRYEQRYVNERLDTVVTVQECQDYYEAHPDKFILSSSVVKARYLKISEESPMLSRLKDKMSSSEAADVFEADSIAYTSAQKFMTWNDEWVDISIIASEFGVSEKELLAAKKGKWIEMNDGLGMKNVLYVQEIVYPGEQAPFEYADLGIRDIIISNRKHLLLLNLEQNLLEEARADGNFIIY